MKTERIVTERIVVISDHRHAANLWVALNQEALRPLVEGEDVSIVTADNWETIRGWESDRLIILGTVPDDFEHWARYACRRGPAQVIHVGYPDRLARGWRT